MSFSSTFVKVVCLAGFTFAASVQAAEADTAAIAERLKPAGTVCLVGDACASAAPVAAVAARSGEDVYNSACAGCHGAGILGAPKKDDSAEWEKRVSAAGNFDKLLANAISGVNGIMPPKGNCTNCSDDELGAAIEFMSGLKH